MKLSHTPAIQKLMFNSYSTIEKCADTMDFDLTFLDDYCRDREMNYGAKKFDEKKKKAVIRSTGVFDSQPKDLNFGAYDAPTIGATMKANTSLQ